MMKENAIREIGRVIERYPCLALLQDRLIQCVKLFADSYRSGGKLLICGNGGSAADCLHMVGELMKGFALERGISLKLQKELSKQYPKEAPYYIRNLQTAVPAIALVNEISLMTAYSNDRAADLVIAQQVLGYGCPKDILFVISTSGRSANVIHAARIACALGVKVISLTGQGGGNLAELSDVLLDVPSNITYQIQELHLPVYHALCLATEQELFGE